MLYVGRSRSSLRSKNTCGIHHKTCLETIISQQPLSIIRYDCTVLVLMLFGIRMSKSLLGAMV